MALNKTETETAVAIGEQYYGNPSVNVGWDDLANSLIGRRLYSNQGTVDYNYAEHTIKFSANGDIGDDNDCVIWNIQKPHAVKESSTLNMHFHYEQTNALDRTFVLQYRIQKTNEAKTTTWQEVTVSTNTNNVFPYTSGILNQICKLVDIDWGSSPLSSTVQLRLTRTDAVAGVVGLTFVDGHVARDQDRGSRQEYVK